MSAETDRATAAGGPGGWDPSHWAPVPLPANRIRRFYGGGARIDALRDGVGVGPEEWLGSTTSSFGEPLEGLSRLADGRLLRDTIGADPVGYLGVDHVARWGPDPALLVKLLDAGERLAVHFHPGREFARLKLGLPFGKTEAWIIVSAEPGAAMHVGLQADVDHETVARWVADQDGEAMLAALREVPVSAGDVLFVPAGTLHTIGAGILLVELQEPTDLSVVLEWQRFSVDAGTAHLGLGWEQVLTALNTDAGPPVAGPVASPERPADGAVRDLFPPVVDPYFRAQRIEPAGAPVLLEPSFSIVIVLDGTLVAAAAGAEPVQLTRGMTALIPHGAGPVSLDGDATVIRCLPPAPDVGDGRW